MRKFNYVFEMVFANDFDFEYVKTEIETLNLVNWAEELGYKLWVGLKNNVFLKSTDKYPEFKFYDHSFSLTLGSSRSDTWDLPSEPAEVTLRKM